MQSNTPLYVGSPGAFLITCSLVFTTSNGLTDNAAVEPAAQPDKNDHQNTATNNKKNQVNKNVLFSNCFQMI